MADEPDNLVLEHLRAIRGDVGQIKSTVNTHTRRLDSLQSEMALVHRKLADQAMEMTEIVIRLERIERRLGLVDAPN